MKTNCLYWNNGNSNLWLKVKCVGTVSNRSAIGAKVRVKASLRGKTFWRARGACLAAPKSNSRELSPAFLVEHYEILNTKSMNLLELTS